MIGFRKVRLVLRAVSSRVHSCPRYSSSWSPLGAAFNAKPARKLNFSFTNGNAGLFEISELADFYGFYALKERAISESSKLVAEATEPGRQRKMVEIFDELSDTLCRVADLAEFIRVAHPNLNFATAAEDASVNIAGLVEKLNTNRALYKSLRHVTEQGDMFPEDDVDRHVAKLFLFDFEQSGIHLEESKRKRVVELNEEILKVGSQFMEATQQPISIKKEALPEHLRYSFNLEGDNVIVTGMYSESHNEAVREAAYKIYLHHQPFQEERLLNLLTARHELAALCGFSSYAHRATSGTLADNPETVMQFLEGLVEEVRPAAVHDLDILEQYKAKHKSQASVLQPWDVPYYTAVAKHGRHKVDHSEFAKYFPLGACMEGLNELFRSLYNVTLEHEPVEGGEVWCDEVYKLAVLHEEEGVLGYIYCDFFERIGKPQQDCHFTIRGGRQTRDGTYQLPVVVLMLNLPEPSWSTPSLLSPGMVENLFHEMGHAMHSMLGRTKYQHVTGTRCSTDFAEVPSVLMEYFATDPRVLSSFAKHYKTCEPIPEDMVTSLCASKYMFNACETQLQVFYSVLDQRLHGIHPLETSLVDLVADTQNEFYSMKHVSQTVWPLRFAHLVGYGAKYYSYLMSRAVASRIWHECFADDPFSRANGELYRRTLLAHGGGKLPMTLIEDLLKKRPTTQDFVQSLVEDVNSR
ncbi:PREDICTED: mitochondrial intermediate peptidase-like [Priapulus caudatus]|uniref:Mitochondrial intermediate peptidase-like n=1 Tax=Priapulus caudatus TaxID=37621 RepID=A0ABM1F905_PRICU|nr:PREDICTED: mitochondrial intermediate peptidase-like [Priapulus caudatus]XP_014680925.1 PREDICTED: mitochondrial intermediate peptidase-like [Priapulus caudatus]XP_014680926.1 PREDICTED: mitochondrial intermediate peptidase-like [Priapulus caudatus]XP_014680927.1 PREDICTED: mitochondrial intermediate peptidase-like [Priapulus caudatus]